MKISKFPLISIGLCCLMALGPTAHSQEDEVSYEDRQFAIGMTPQHMLKNGFRVDVEWMVDYPEHSLVIAPLYYYGFVNNSLEEIESKDLMSGYGFEVIHKYYLNDKTFGEDDRKIYFGHGPYFRRYKMTFDAVEWKDQPGEDGIQVYRQELTEHNRNVSKFGYSVMFGINMMPYDNFLMDIYAGMGIRGTSATSTLPEEHKHARKYDRNFFDYEYQGPVLLMGFKLGVLL